MMGYQMMLVAVGVGVRYSNLKFEEDVAPRDPLTISRASAVTTDMAWEISRVWWGEEKKRVES